MDMLSFVDIPNNTPQTQSAQLGSAINIQKWIQRKTRGPVHETHSQG